MSKHKHFHTHVHCDCDVQEVLAALGAIAVSQLKLEDLMSKTWTEFKADLEAANDVAKKNQTETVALLDKIASQSNNVPQDILDAADALRATLNATDVLVPDMPSDPPTP